MNIIDIIEKENLKDDAPQFNIGDTVKVFVKIKEGDKERLQAYEGVVIARKNGSVRETFTVRRISYGVGVERTFPVHSPLIDHVEVTRKGKPRRAKLYYVRNLTGKAAKIKSADNN
ncbi:MAG: 50S ribosomal protein L19 [Clostridia bacterium]|nr:50S ribosomal protein L19 [Clostridia bacterium]